MLKRVLTIVALTFIIFSLPVFITNKTKDFATNNQYLDFSNTIPSNNIEAVDDVILETRIQRKAELQRIADEKLFNDQVNAVENILSRYNSPMAGYGHIIVQKAKECGGDYRILTAIAGNESGFGKVPYKLYNPYGYLDGVQYSGWEDSLSYLSCVISQRFIAPCAGDITCIEHKYGGVDTPHEQWVRNITYFVNLF